MIFSDGNYNVDYESGKLTVFDFENCRSFFYLFDLANLWTHGVGWIAHERDASKRKSFMTDYFDVILDGYRTETQFDKNDLAFLPLMIQAVLLENVVDEFEVQLAQTGGFTLDGEQAYRIECLVKDVPFVGFFDEIYDVDNAFEIEL